MLETPRESIWMNHLSRNELADWVIESAELPPSTRI